MLWEVNPNTVRDLWRDCVRLVAFSPDGLRLAVGNDQGLSLHDVKTGKKMCIWCQG